MKRKPLFLYYIALFIIVLSALSLRAQVPPQILLKILNNNPKLLQGTSQVIIISGSSASTHGLLYTFERVKDAWQMQFIPMGVVIGKKGFAGEEAAVEGDLFTPSGVFTVATAAGTEKNPDTKLEYSYWNGGIPLFETILSSGEKDRRTWDSFRYCILLRSAGKNPSTGDRFMVHLWPSQKNATAGSVGISEINMLKLLKWLDKDKNPTIITGTLPFLQNLQ